MKVKAQSVDHGGRNIKYSQCGDETQLCCRVERSQALECNVINIYS